MSDSKAVARYDGPRTIDELVRYSQVMADGRSVLPKQFRDQPGAILFAVEYAKALDVSPVTAITGIHVVDGKPTASSGLISALIRRAGHTLRVKLEGTYETGDLKATATLIRSDDPDETYTSTWTLDRAVRANLMRKRQDGRYVAVKEKSAWDTYPENMLKARAITEVGRDAAEDVLLGVHYAAEELGADVDANGDVITVEQVPNRAADDVARQEQATAPQPAAEGDEQDHPAEAERIRDAIIEAETEEQLTAVWTGGIKTKAYAEQLGEVADEYGEATTILDLLSKAGASVRAGLSLLAAKADADAAEADKRAAATRAAQTPQADHVPSEGPDAEPVDAETVEDQPAAEEPPAAPAPSKSETLDELERTIALLPQPQAFAELSRVMHALTADEAGKVGEWAKSMGVDPRHSAANCAWIVRAVAEGEPFGDGVPVGDPAEDPVMLVMTKLDATIIEEIHHTREQQYRAQVADREAAARAEDRADAVTATAAGAGDRRERANAAIAEAKAAARAAAQQ